MSQIILQQVSQTVLAETPPPPAWQSEVGEDWELGEGPQAEWNGGVGGCAVESDHVVEDSAEEEMTDSGLDVKLTSIRPPGQM